MANSTHKTALSSDYGEIAQWGGEIPHTNELPTRNSSIRQDELNGATASSEHWGQSLVFVNGARTQGTDPNGARAQGTDPCVLPGD